MRDGEICWSSACVTRGTNGFEHVGKWSWHCTWFRLQSFSLLEATERRLVSSWPGAHHKVLGLPVIRGASLDRAFDPVAARTL